MPPQSQSQPEPPTLYAISDLHLSHAVNLKYFSTLPSQKHDFPKNSGLILAGDVGESISHLRTAIEISLQVFKYIWWVPGNHELYTIPRRDSTSAAATTIDNEISKSYRNNDSAIDLSKGEQRYHAFVEVCRSYPNVFTPEDEWMIWDPLSTIEPLIHPSSLSSSSAGTHSKSTSSPSPSAALICPLFTLYDYTFRPTHLHTVAEALSWAEEADVYATDEALLHPDPYPNKESWSSTLITTFHNKLTTARNLHPDLPFILINHWPLCESVLHIPAIPRFSIWCGSKRTAHWTSDFAPVSVVVSGHLHVRRTDWIEGVRWEEVSLGYPRQWERIREGGLKVGDVLRQILPAPESVMASGTDASDQEGDGKQRTEWRRLGGR